MRMSEDSISRARQEPSQILQTDERTVVELCGIILSTKGPEDKLFPRLKKKIDLTEV